MVIGLIDVMLGVALLAIHATEWQWLGTFANKISMRDKKAFRIGGYIVGAILVLVGLALCLFS